jgi:hypothetical protein
LPRRKTSAPSSVTGWVRADLGLRRGAARLLGRRDVGAEAPGRAELGTAHLVLEGGVIDRRSMVNGGSFSGSVMAPGRNES